MKEYTFGDAFDMLTKFQQIRDIASEKDVNEMVEMLCYMEQKHIPAEWEKLKNNEKIYNSCSDVKDIIDDHIKDNASLEKEKMTEDSWKEELFNIQGQGLAHIYNWLENESFELTYTYMMGTNEVEEK